jgi:hypothetical protein
METKNFCNRNEPINGCHVVAHIWAMWHRSICLLLPHVHLLFDHLSTKLSTQSPATVPVLATWRTNVPHVTLAMVTHHPSICPVSLPHQLYRPFHISANCALPCQLYGCTTCIVSCHVALYGLYSHHFLHVWQNEQIMIFGAY